MPDIFISHNNTNTANNNPDTTTATINSSNSSSSSSSNTNHQSHTAVKAITGIPGMLSTFIEHPQKLSFSQQDEDEEIMIFVRRHFITNLPWVVTVILAIIAPLFIIPLVKILNFSPLPFSLNLSITLIFFYYLLALGFALYNFVDWFYNIGIASNKRLLDLDFIQLSHIDLALTLLTEVEDVVYRQQGFFASYFNYGDVIAHTVTGKEDFVFEKVPNPDKVVDIISRYIGDHGD